MKKPSEAVLEIARGLAPQMGMAADSPPVVLGALLRYLDAEAVPKPVVCPECTAAGKKSRILRGGPSMTRHALYHAPKQLFDEDGREHFHDENRQSETLHYACSDGHEFSEQHMTPCWCGWPNVGAKPSQAPGHAPGVIDMTNAARSNDP